MGPIEFCVRRAARSCGLRCFRRLNQRVRDGLAPVVAESSSVRMRLRGLAALAVRWAFLREAALVCCSASLRFCSSWARFQ